MEKEIQDRDSGDRWSSELGLDVNGRESPGLGEDRPMGLVELPRSEGRHAIASMVAMLPEVTKQYSKCDGHAFFSDRYPQGEEREDVILVKVPEQRVPRSDGMWMQCPESEVFNKRMISMMREQWKFLGTTESAKSIAVGCPQFMRGKQEKGLNAKEEEKEGDGDADNEKEKGPQEDIEAANLERLEREKVRAKTSDFLRPRMPRAKEKRQIWLIAS
eukprot:Skav218788  [mRNA]  locus=scaffold1140:48699:65831:- [translate_table: standard]